MRTAVTLIAGGIALAAAASALGWAARADDGKPASFTQAQVDQGQDLYRANCASCHGQNLNDGEFAPALKSMGFRTKWSGQSVGALFAYATANMPPGQAGVLGPDDYAALTAFMLHANGAAASDKALPADAQTLSGLNWPH